MPRYRRILVDGYSFIHRDPALSALVRRNLLLAREKAVAMVERIAGAMSDDITIVFDGQGTQEAIPHPSILHIMFSPANKTADTVIEQIVGRDPDPATILVVSSDRRERETVMAAGAQSMSCGEFLENLVRHDTQFRARKTRRPPTLGDLFPGL